MLGVTIALWADGWVAERSDRAEELARLEVLQDNVVGTLAELACERDTAQGAVEALRGLATLPEDGLPPRGVDELLRYGLLFGATFYPELNVYDDLKNSGELALLTNQDLRRALAMMDARLEKVKLAQADLSNVQQRNIDAYMLEQLDLRAFYGDVVGLEIATGEPEMNLEFTTDTAFRNIVLLKLDLVSQLVAEFDGAGDALAGVQETIALQLAESPR